MRKNKLTLLFGIIFLISLNIIFGCYTPNGDDENTYFDENSGSNLTLCVGNYYFNDSGSPDGVFHLQGSNYIFDCNNSNLYGNQSGSRKGLMFRFTGENITLKNCNILEFLKGIKFESSSNNLIKNINFTRNMDNDILINGNNNIFNNIYSIGDWNGDASIKIENSQNNTFSNLNLNQINNGFWLLNANNNTFENIIINKTGSQGIKIESGDNNFFKNISFEQTGSHAIELGSNNNTIDDIKIISSGYHGINIWGNNNTIKNSNISNTQEYGIKFNSDTINNLIFNNYFSNNLNGNIYINSQINNYFNTTKTLGTNIIGGDYIGGNFYDNYTGIDTTGDGIGNISYDLGGVYDYLPLTNNQSIPTNSCYTPNGDDNYINEDITLCRNTYYLNDTLGSAENYGVFIINSSDITFDCNSSLIIGDNNRIAIRIDDGISNTKIINCNILNYSQGIDIESSYSVLENINISNVGNSAIIFDEYLNNISLENISLENVANMGISFESNNFNILMENLFFNNISTLIEGGNLVNITLKNSKFINSEFGFYIESGLNITIDNLTLKNINYSGIRFDGVSNSTIKNSNFTNINMDNNSWQAGIIFSIFDDDYLAKNNLIYNNYISNNNINNILIQDNQINNSFNTTKTLGTNIIGGDYIGGNYYDDYNGTDSNSDGIGEDTYNVSNNVYDYLPLTNNQTIVEDEFKTIENQTITLGENAILELFIKNIESTSNLNISWDDGLNTFNSSAQTNGTIYYHNYTNFGNYSVNTTLIGCKSGNVCSTGNTYLATMWINVIGYGDGIINGNESCDTNNFGSKTCSNYGYNAGSLTCNNGNIETSNCYTQSSGGGGGGHHRKKNDNNKTNISIIKIPINNSLNISKFNNSIINSTLNISINKTISNKSLFNNSNLNINFSKNSNNTFINKTYNFSILKNTNISLLIPEINKTKFNFKPYLKIVFNIFSDQLPKEKYSFKPKLNLIFSQFSNEINLNKKKQFNFKNKLNLIFSQFSNEINRI